LDAVSDTEPPVERPQERDDVRAARREARELDRRLDSLRAAVAQVGPGTTAGDRRALRQAAADLGVDGQIEVRCAEVEQLARLLPDRPDDRGMGVAGGVDRDAGGEVQEQVAVDVLDGQALATDRHDRIGARQARRRPGLVEGDVVASLGAGDLGDDVGDRSSPREARRGVGQGATSCMKCMQAGYRAGV
jgi:hypothetical protein